MFLSGMDQKNRIRTIRTMLGLTQADMSDKLNISLTAYNLKENGKINFNDNDKVIIKELAQRVDPHLTIDDIFF